MKRHSKVFLKQTAACFLAAALIVAGTACQNKSSASGTNVQSAKSYFDADGKLKTPFVTKKTTFRVMWNKNSDDKGNISDKVILNQAFKATGITWDVQEVADVGWDEKVSVTFASGDLPDLFCGQIKNLANYTKQCCDITKLLPEYAPYTSNFIQKQYPAAAKTETFDDKIYSLPEIRINNLYPAGGLWEINTTWLKKLGLSVPTTTDQLYQVLKAFKSQDLNGNGKADEIPYSFNGVTDNTDGILNMMNCFGLVNDGVNRTSQYIMVEKGKVIFTPTDKRFYDMLFYLHKLYSEGLLDPDGFVQKASDRYAKTSANRVGFVTGGGLTTGVWGGDSYKQVEFMKVPASQYGAVIRTNDPAGELTTNVYTISKSCKHPELLLLFMEYCNSTPDNRFLSLFGPENGAWKYDSSGKVINQTDFTGKSYSTVAQARATLGPGYRLATVITADDEGRRLYTGTSLQYQNAIKDTYGPASGQDYKECFPIGNDSLQNSAARTEEFTEINNYIQNFVATSVMNGIDETKWNAHVQSCDKLNVKKYVADFQSLYNKLKKK